MGKTYDKAQVAQQQSTDEPKFPEPIEIDGGRMSAEDKEKLPRFLRVFGSNPLAFYD